MKQIIIASSVLLTAGAIYGFIDYRQQSNSGKLNQLYKDEVYNSGGKPTSVVFAAAKVEKKVDLDDYSRGPIQEEQYAANTKTEAPVKVGVKTKKTIDKDVAPKPVKVKNEPVVEKISEADTDEYFEKALVKAEKPEPKTAEVKIVYLASAGDSTEFRNNEAKAIKRAMFSRAPIRKKSAAVIVVNADSAVAKITD